MVITRLNSLWNHLSNNSNVWSNKIDLPLYLVLLFRALCVFIIHIIRYFPVRRKIVWDIIFACRDLTIYSHSYMYLFFHSHAHGLWEGERAIHVIWLRIIRNIYITHGGRNQFRSLACALLFLYNTHDVLFAWFNTTVIRRKIPIFSNGSFLFGGLSSTHYTRLLFIFACIIFYCTKNLLF